jgi:ribosome-binding factor A
MSSDRMLRINTLIRQEIASFLYKEINDPDFDMSAVTVTQVITSSNLRHARVLVSIRADPPKQGQMLQRLREHRIPIQEQIGRQVVIKYTPQISFELDESIAKGDHVLHMISELEAQHPEWPEPDDDAQTSKPS